MKHLFVPKNIAQLARDNGFNEVCLAAYGAENDDNNSFQIWSEDGIDNHSSSHLAAPLYQQLIDWFRNKHGIVIWIETAPYTRTFNFRFYIETSDNRQEGHKSKDYYKVYNEALIEGFKLIVHYP